MTLSTLSNEMLEKVLFNYVLDEIRDTQRTPAVGWETLWRPIKANLSAVCIRWKTVLCSRSFQLQLNVALAPTLQLVYRHMVQSATALTTMANELYILTKPDKHTANILVYDQQNMSTVYHTIKLDEFQIKSPTDLASSTPLQCLYIFDKQNPESQIWCIKREGDRQYSCYAWKSHIKSSSSTLTVSNQNRLIIVDERNVIKEYTLAIALSRITQAPKCVETLDKVIQSSTGNFIFTSFQTDHMRRLIQIDGTGTIINKLRLPLFEPQIYTTDVNDNLFIAEPGNKFRFLDRDLERIEVNHKGKLWKRPSALHFNELTGEWVLIDNEQSVMAFKIEK